MCFSAPASFTAAAVLATIGVATLRHVREPRTLLFACVPLLFAVHQFGEGLVWLALEGRLGPTARDHLVFLYTLYAIGILPLLMPVAVVLMEPPGWRRGAILALCAVGALVFAWDMTGLIVAPTCAVIDQHSITYSNPITSRMWVSLLYILATCSALLLSTHRVVRGYGLLNVFGLTIVHLVKGYAFASVWCFYAAVLSVVLYRQFHQQDIDVATPNGTSAVRRPFVLSWLRG
ncbi:DUF6629 family protein [Sphingomonas hylomeconis]|uniref:DUF6629 family protein n=1 Tax=Sphingomonas hylomeconis TaxID=1395958 RepID=A0ABV7SUQ6_9SPHN|nr:DUF6629 family protein [Sphingomonas hylomeconis]